MYSGDTLINTQTNLYISGESPKNIFRIMSHGKTIEQEGCSSAWFDEPDPEGVQECFQQTVSNDRLTRNKVGILLQKLVRKPLCTVP